jgi:hypothetical protein
MGSEPAQDEDPIAKKLKEAAAHDREATDAAAGESLLTADFATFARDHGPSELRKIEELALARVSRINAQAPPAQFRYDQSARSIEAGVYSANLAVVTGSQFQVRLAVGLASDAAQRMAPVPVVEPRTWHYRASADQDGFFWLDEATGGKCFPEEIVSNALEAPSHFLIAPLPFEDEDPF